jgi:hypothetical protein
MTELSRLRKELSESNVQLTVVGGDGIRSLRIVTTRPEALPTERSSERGSALANHEHIKDIVAWDLGAQDWVTFRIGQVESSVVLSHDGGVL